MNSEELRKQSQKIISEARTQTNQEDELAADKITNKIPDLIKEAIAKKLKIAGVMILTEIPKPKRLAPHPFDRRETSDVFEQMFSSRFVTEYELTGVAKIVFDHCKNAGLNPYAGQTEDKSKWGIGICWE